MPRRSSSAMFWADPAVMVGGNKTSPLASTIAVSAAERRNYNDYDTPVNDGNDSNDSEAAVERWLTSPANNSNAMNKDSNNRTRPQDADSQAAAAAAAATATAAAATFATTTPTSLRAKSSARQMTRGQRLLRDRLSSAGRDSGSPASKSPSKASQQRQHERQLQAPRPPPTDFDYHPGSSNGGYLNDGIYNEALGKNSPPGTDREHQKAFTFDAHEYVSSEYHHEAERGSSNLRGSRHTETLREDPMVALQHNYRMPSPGMAAPPPPPKGPPAARAAVSPTSSPRHRRSNAPGGAVQKRHPSTIGGAGNDANGRERLPSPATSSPVRRKLTLSPQVSPEKTAGTARIVTKTSSPGGVRRRPSVANGGRNHPAATNSCNNFGSGDNAFVTANSPKNSIKDALARSRSNVKSSRNRMKALYQQHHQRQQQQQLTRKRTTTDPVSPSRTGIASSTIHGGGPAKAESPTATPDSSVDEDETDNDVDGTETEHSKEHSSALPRRQRYQALASSSTRSIHEAVSQAETERITNGSGAFHTATSKKRTTPLSPPRGTVRSHHQYGGMGRAVSTGRIRRQPPPLDASDEEREKAEMNTRGPSRGRAAQTTEPRQQALMVTTQPKKFAFAFPGASDKDGTSLFSFAMLRKTNRIMLHVYDLVARDTELDLWGCHFPLGQVFNALNSSLHSMGTGAYHVGIEINGVEYAYGANGTKGLTGLFTCTPKHSPGYQFRTTIDFGDRFVTKQLQPVDSTPQSAYALVACDGREIIRAMASDYMGTDYDLFRKNCCTFAHDACIRLGVNEQEIPNWFHNLAAAGAVTQDAANSTLGPLTHAFTACELDKFAQYINDTAFDDGFEVIKACADSDNSEQIVDHTYR